MTITTTLSPGRWLHSGVYFASRIAIAVVLCTSVHPADADASGLRECAIHDLRAISQIEHRSEIPGIRSNVLFESWNLVIDARAACASGRFTDAFASYDEVDRRLFAPASIEPSEVQAELEVE